MALLLVGFGLVPPDASQSKAIAMTDCNRDCLPFSSLGPKAVVADFRGGRLTTDWVIVCSSGLRASAVIH